MKKKIKNYKKVGNSIYIQLLEFVPIIIFAVFLGLYYLNIITIRSIDSKELQPLNYPVRMSSYPFLNGILAPDISAESAVIADAESHRILFSKNPDLRFSPASTTKIMTALTAFEYYKDGSILTIFSPKVDGSNIGFVQGEKYNIHNLLLAMLLPSSNEAAVAIAQNYPGGIDAFVRRMNEKAIELDLKNTHFIDPSGLDDDNNYSTSSDMARLASELLKNKTLSEIVGTKTALITDISGQHKIMLANLNKLLGVDGVNGIKTGTTVGAGEVLVTSKPQNGHTFIMVVMKSKNRFQDTRELIALLNKNVKFFKPEYPGELGYRF